MILFVSGSVSSSRRRSRAKSGDSSALSEPENADEIVSEKFKYPIRVSEDHDDDVSKQYIRGSRSPPGIANHLLRSARTDKSKEPVKSSVDVNNTVEKQAPMPETSCSSKASIGHSAKKRWLMAAMSVDMTENEEGSGRLSNFKFLCERGNNIFPSQALVRPPLPRQSCLTTPH